MIKDGTSIFGSKAAPDAPVPLVSVVVPAYNAEKTLSCLLESIKEQTFNNYEVIVVDDGSSDATSDAFYQAAGSDPRFQLVRLAENQGVSNARNVGIDFAKGEYLYFCDADDAILPETLCELVTACSDADIVLVSARLYKDETSWELYVPWDGLDLEIIEQNGPIAGGCAGYVCCYFFRRSIIGVERFNSDFSLLEDAEFMSRVCRGGLRYAYCDKALYCYNTWTDGSALNTMTVEKVIIHKRMRCLLEKRTRGSVRSEMLLRDYAHSCFGVLRRVAGNKFLFYKEAALNEDELHEMSVLTDWRTRLVLLAARFPRAARYLFIVSSCFFGQEE